MAKWGEGDPRWIVEERPDATNVNNWHWTEKNAGSWSKDKLRELLVNLKLDNSAGKCKITSIDKCEGDASANNRKAKIIVFFEWDLRLKWKGTDKENEESLEGTIEIPNLSDENSVDDLDIQFTTDASKGNKMKEALRAECVGILKESLLKYMNALKQEYTAGMILPKKEESTMSATMSNLKLSPLDQRNGAIQPVAGAQRPVKLDLRDIETSSSMKCTPIEVFNALMKPEMFVAFTNGGRIDPKVGGVFDMFGGNVTGRIISIDCPKKIVQTWRFKHWPDGHFSEVTFTFHEKDDATEILVKQKGVPATDVEKTKEGWNRYYWDAMKRTFGFGSFIL